MIIQTSGYSAFFQSSNIQRSSSLDEICMYKGLGKYKRVLEQKNEFQKLMEKEQNKKDGDSFCARV